VQALIAVVAVDPALEAVTAETSIQNISSQRVLLKNDFVATGISTISQECDVVVWRRRVRWRGLAREGETSVL